SPQSPSEPPPPTTAAVGPSSLISLAPFALPRQYFNPSLLSSSPPITSAPATSSIFLSPNCLSRISKCAGVIFTRLYPRSSLKALANPSTPLPSGNKFTLLPLINGKYRLVTVRSKPIDELTGGPSPSPIRYAPLAHRR